MAEHKGDNITKLDNADFVTSPDALASTKNTQGPLFQFHEVVDLNDITAAVADTIQVARLPAGAVPQYIALYAGATLDNANSATIAIGHRPTTTDTLSANSIVAATTVDTLMGTVAREIKNITKIGGTFFNVEQTTETEVIITVAANALDNGAGKELHVHTFYTMNAA